MNDIPARLAAVGIDSPLSGPLPLAEGVAAAGFPSAGDEALDWWRRLREGCTVRPGCGRC